MGALDLAQGLGCSDNFILAEGKSAAYLSNNCTCERVLHARRAATESGRHYIRGLNTLHRTCVPAQGEKENASVVQNHRSIPSFS